VQGVPAAMSSAALDIITRTLEQREMLAIGRQKTATKLAENSCKLAVSLFIKVNIIININ
jgi:hypothetical protein